MRQQEAIPQGLQVTLRCSGMQFPYHHAPMISLWREFATRASNALEKMLNYIHENPVAARFVDQEEDYPYSSAFDYSGQKGLI
ncbi:MAG: hypothetical protein PF486_08410 [Prolixibacteraceae bacterium]|jgi:hypothetical protein|nr:hypothetical protein [Prolixibacteraceae bacterium]